MNTTTDGWQIRSQLTALADGRFVISFTERSESVDHHGTITNVRAQIFDPRESAIDLKGTAAGDDYVGTRFDDTLRGSFGDDRLTGEDGDDRLHGGKGDDVLVGGAGDDLLIGGAGRDTFVFAPGDGSDRIAGFQFRQDAIDLSAFHLANRQAVIAAASQHGSGLVFAFDTGDSLAISGLNIHQLRMVDFIL